MKSVFCLFFSFILSSTSFSQIIDKMEYFFDTDPGVGKATPISFTSYTQVDQTFTADISSLTNGLHRLFVRAKDSTGKWSLLATRLFNVTETEKIATASEIIAMEYFFDTDPGTGNGTPVEVSANSDLSISISNDLSELEIGIHKLYVRAKDNSGQWSLLGSRLFQIKTGNDQFAATINSIQWTVSGNGITPYSESKTLEIPLSDISENVSPDLSTLSSGNYTIKISAIDNNGISSIPQLAEFSLSAPALNTKSAQFDGLGDRIRVTDSAPLNGNAIPSAYQISGNAITTEAWVFVTSLPENGKGEVILGRSASGTFGVDPYFSYALKLDNYSDGKPAFNFTISNGNAGSALYAIADTVPVEKGKWYHIAGTYDGNALKIYINGELKNSISSNSLSIGTGGVGLYIGGTVSEYFTGLIDEVRLWNVTRSGSEISDNMNSNLLGTEPGLAGYWPLDSVYTSGNNSLTPDMTSNKNDLAVQFDVKLISSPAGSSVQINPTQISFTTNYGLSGVNLNGNIITDGWPQSTFNLTSGPSGLILEGNLYSWTPGSEVFGNNQIILTANNGGTILTDTVYIYIDNFVETDNANQLTVINRGKIGTYSSFSRGLIYNGQNGLFAGDFSLVDANQNKFAGGLNSTINSFHPLTIFQPVESKLTGYSAYQSSMDDAWESNRINVKVLQTVFSKSTSPDNKYSIMEYKIINTSGAEIDSLFPQFTADFDIGNSSNNKGGYDSDLQLTYGYEADGLTNSNYYGFALLNKSVSGSHVIINGADANYFRTTKNLTTTGISTSTGDIRNLINAGPFILASNETLTIAYAVLAGDDLTDLKQSASFAKQAYNQSTRINQNAAYFGLNGDGLTVTAGFPVNDSANYSAFQNVGKAITAEAWIYGMKLPKQNSEQIIIGRYLAGGTSPYQTYSLRIANYQQDHQPRLEFIISDGINADWGSASVVVSPEMVGQWFHVAGTYDGTTVKLYINGELVAYGNWNKTIGTNGIGLFIGGGPGFGYSTGVADEVKLWNRVKSEEEIKSSMNYTLNGNENGLIGYWPMDETYLKTINGNDYKIFPDISPNNLDMFSSGNVQLVDDIAGTEVKILPKRFRLSDNYVLTGIPYSAKVLTDGWPLPSVSLQNPKSGLTYFSTPNGNQDSIVWNTDFNFWGEYLLKASLTNSSGSVSDSAFMYVALNHELSENKQSLLFTNQGRIGTGGRYGKGLIYKGKNGLFDATLGIISKSENKVSGGLYGQAEFTDNNPFAVNPSPLTNFNSEYESRFTDNGTRNKNPIGVMIRQSIMQKSSVPDDKYSIVEYNVKNTSGKNLQDLYVSLGADFDIGNSTNNLGGYDPANQLSYAYEKDGTNNSSFYGFSLLDESVSGHTLTHSGKLNDDAFALAGVNTFAEIPSTPQDLRNVLYAGPFNLNSGDSILVAFAFVTGDNLQDIQTSAISAKTAYQLRATDVKSAIESPKSFSLSQNYPNPFNPSTRISYTVPKSAEIRISIYDLMGREIAVLENNRKEAGVYNTVWDSKNFSGQTVSSGIYFYRIVAKSESGIEFVKTNKMLLVK